MSRALKRLHCALCFGAGLALASSCSGRDISLGEGRVRTEPPPHDLPEYEEPRVIAGLGDEDAKDDDPALTADLLTLYFNSKRDGGLGQEDIWFTQRATLEAAFSEPRPERALNSERRETGIALSADGLRLWFSSDRPGGAGALDVYLATRARSDSPFRVQRVPELSSAGDDLVSSLADGERRLYLARRDDDDDDYDLFVAQRPDRASAFGAPEAIEALNSDDEESDAVWLEGAGGLVFTRDEQLVYAESERDGQLLTLIALNSDHDDRDAWFSADLGYVAFSSDRSGSYRLYEARRR
jgi:WD40-like Beta Propeller Repeat